MKLCKPIVDTLFLMVLHYQKLHEAVLCVKSFLKIIKKAKRERSIVLIGSLAMAAKVTQCLHKYAASGGIVGLCPFRG